MAKKKKKEKLYEFQGVDTKRKISIFKIMVDHSILKKSFSNFAVAFKPLHIWKKKNSNLFKRFTLWGKATYWIVVRFRSDGSSQFHVHRYHRESASTFRPSLQRICSPVLQSGERFYVSNLTYTYTRESRVLKFPVDFTRSAFTWNPERNNRRAKRSSPRLLWWNWPARGRWPVPRMSIKTKQFRMAWQIGRDRRFDCATPDGLNLPSWTTAR